MIGPVLRVCPECGHENWGERLANKYRIIQLPPPRTCEVCDAPLVVPVRHVDRSQAVLPGVA